MRSAASPIPDSGDGATVAKGILQASRLDLLPKTDPAVHKDLTKVARGEKLSPVLLSVREPEHR
jgi:hypothetical protein